MFCDSDEAMLHVQLLDYLVTDVPKEARSFLPDLVVCLHREVCMSEESRID